MPLDPYFDDMYRARRRDMIAQIRSTVTNALLRLVPRRRPDRTEQPTLGTSAHSTDQTGRPKPTAGRRESVDRSSPAWKRRNARKWDTKLFGRVGVPGPEVPTSDHVVAVRGYPDVRVRLYRPAGDADGPRAGVLSFFGGSFQLGGLDWTSVDAAFRSRAEDAGVVVAGVDYALAPEHRFPTAVEQGYAALVWLQDHAEELGVDPARIAINGTSSGGNIAAAVALLARDRGRPPLALQVLEVPALDLTGRHIDFQPLRRMRIPLILARRELVSVAEAYLTDRRLAADPVASPLLSPSLAGLPPAHVLVSEFDPLRGDGIAYVEALRRAGVDASAVEYMGATHEAAMYRAVVPLAERWHRDVVTALRSV